MLVGDTVTGAREMTVGVLGVAFRVGFDETIGVDDVARIRRSWSRCVTESAAQAIDVSAGIGIGSGQNDEIFSVRSSTLAQFEETLTSSLTIRAIGEQKQHLLMLHACGVADEDGRVVALVAASGTGKTTAARVLGGHYRYVSDETVALARDGSVVPYPKPLSVKQTGEPQPKVQLAPDEAGLRPLSGAALTLAAVVMLDRRPDVVQAHVETVHSADALCELVPQTSYLSARERPLTELLQVFAERGGVRRVVYAEAESLPPLIAEILAEPQRSAAEVESEFEIVELVEPIVADVPTTPAVRRVRADDVVLADDGDLLLFSNNTVLRLSGLGPLIWNMTGSWVDVDAVTAAIVAAAGNPPDGVDARETVLATLGELTSAGVLDASPEFFAMPQTSGTTP
jgi:hypothetical protein